VIESRPSMRTARREACGPDSQAARRQSLLGRFRKRPLHLEPFWLRDLIWASWWVWAYGWVWELAVEGTAADAAWSWSAVA
jgi:hypothetical protein